MNRLKLVLLSAALAIAASSCGTTSSLVQRWNEPSYTGKKDAKMFIFALAQNERNMKIWESAFGNALTAVHVKPIPSSSMFAFGTSLDSTALRGYVHNSGADLLAVTRLVDVEKEQVYVPGSTYYTPAPAYYGYYGYYYSSWGMVSTPGYYETQHVYRLETNVYDVASEKLVWSGLTETVDPSNAEDGANSIAAVIIDDMLQRKVLVK
jgi:hypothetical protein